MPYQLVSGAMAPGVLGAPPERFRSDARPWRVLRSNWGRLLAHARQMFTWWHRVREGTLQPATFRSYMTALRREVERLLEAGRHCGMPKTAGTCRDILTRREALWTFVQVDGVGADQQCGREGAPSRGTVAQGQLWHAECRGLTLCRKYDDRGGNVEATAAQRLRVSHRGM